MVIHTYLDVVSEKDDGSLILVHANLFILFVKGPCKISPLSLKSKRFARMQPGVDNYVSVLYSIMDAFSRCKVQSPEYLHG